MRDTSKCVGAFLGKLRPGRLFQATLPALAICLAMAGAVWAHGEKSMGQKVYVPVYSTIAYFSQQNLDLTVTLSFRNLDAGAPITVSSVVYFDTGGKKVKDLLGGARTLAPFGSTHVVIKRQDFRGDVGANVVVEWSAKSPVIPPLFEAIMVGSRGTGAFSFASRGVVLN